MFSFRSLILHNIRTTCFYFGPNHGYKGITDFTFYIDVLTITKNTECLRPLQPSSDIPRDFDYCQATGTRTGDWDWGLGSGIGE